MDLFEHHPIDLVAERARINRPGTYNKRQRQALHKLVDLCEILRSMGHTAFYTVPQMRAALAKTPIP